MRIEFIHRTNAVAPTVDEAETLEMRQAAADYYATAPASRADPERPAAPKPAAGTQTVISGKSSKTVTTTTTTTTTVVATTEADGSSAP